jgi:Zn-finger nucleic acid-binding protein
MRCAKCPGELVIKKVGAVAVNQCDGCHGVWFDRRELDTVLKAGAAKLLEHGGGAPYRSGEGADDALEGVCPRCSLVLERHDSLAVEGLHFDQCPGCQGVWLDQGEAQKLASDPTAAAIGGFFTK